MRRPIPVCVLLLPALAVGAPAAKGQECFKLEKETAKIIGNAGGSDCPIGCSGCGCKGGPGYRAPRRGTETRGHCVGYANLYSVCGPPPHAKCTRECTPVVVGCKRPDKRTAEEKLAKKKQLKRQFTSPGLPQT